MSDKPQDPAQETVDQEERHAETFEGQKGYGVEFEDGRYRSDNMQEMPPGGRAGSYETGNNTGDYGSGQQGAGGGAMGGEPAVLSDVAGIGGSVLDQGGVPAVLPPDPEAQQGQGGQ